MAPNLQRLGDLRDTVIVKLCSTADVKRSSASKVGHVDISPLTDELQDDLEINWDLAKDENIRAAFMDQNKHQAVAETGAKRKKKEQFMESCEKLLFKE